MSDKDRAQLEAIEEIIRDWYADKTTTREIALLKIDQIIRDGKYGKQREPPCSL